MENLIKWFKEKWILVLGGFGVVIVTLGAILGRKKVAEDKTKDLHAKKIEGLESARQIEDNAKELILKIEEEAAIQHAKIEKEKVERAKSLEEKEQAELTVAVADKFNFKNGDEK